VSKETGRYTRGDRYRDRRDEKGELGDRRDARGDRYRDSRDEIGK
jgi:hypothetical protein